MGEEPGGDGGHVSLRAALNTCKAGDLPVVVIEGTDEFLKGPLGVLVDVVQIDTRELGSRAIDVKIDRPARVELKRIPY